MSETKNVVPKVQMRVVEILTGTKATIKVVDTVENQVWMLADNQQVGVFKLESFWEFFKEIKP